MTLNLPPNIESIARKKAAAAGLSGVDEFVQRLIENASPEQALLPPPTDPRIIAAIDDGFASGVEGVMDATFWKEREDRLRSSLEKNRGN
ncbi:MAG: hypothetical protein MI757_17880 [Pirellulales bacterium]|nr:hypothetical protein [Pirellulales bacterium]